MNKDFSHIIQPSVCPSLEQLKIYHQGKSSASDRFYIENHLASCEICNDLLEGMSAMRDIDSLPTIENELKDKLKQKLNSQQHKKRKILFYRIAIAASICVLVGIGFFFYNNISRLENPKKEISRNLDSVAIQIPSSEKKLKTVRSPQIRSIEEKLFVSDESTTLHVSSSSDMAVEEQQSASPAPLVMMKSASPDKQIKGAVMGIVKDETGAPLPGATVQIKGTTRGAITDNDGKFALSASPSDSIQISYVGYNSKELPATDSVVEIAMLPQEQSLDEVVVIGYGKQRKSELTGAIARVSNGISFRQEEKLKQRVDSLKTILPTATNKWATTKRFAETYMELKDQVSSLNTIDSLINLDPSKENQLQEIKNLVEKKKYKKALKKLGSIN